MQSRLLDIMSDQMETDPSRLEIDQQINSKLTRKKHVGDRHGHRCSELYRMLQPTSTDAVDTGIEKTIGKHKH